MSFDLRDLNMAIKTYVFAVVCFIHVTVMAVDDELLLPPTMAPEEFDQPMVQPTGELSLKQAIVLTLEHNPELATYAWAIRSKEIDQIEAGLLPNPEATLGIENFAGSGETSSFKSAETTIALSQLIELGEKRMKRRQLASTDHDLARWDYEVKRVDLLTETAKAFISVLSQQEMLAINNEIYSLANDVYTTINKRVEAGKATRLEEMKARVEVSRAKLESINVQRRLTTAKQALVTFWGTAEITFNDVIGDLHSSETPPNLNSIVSEINNNPDIGRWVTEISREQHSVALAQANTIPDVTVSAGVRHLNNSDDVAAVANISIPLFLFNGKQSGVRRSNVELERALKQKEVTELKIRSALKQNYQQLMILYDEVTVLRDEVLPVAEQAFVSAKKIYQLGKLDLLGLLDTQRIYFDVRKQYIETVTAYRHMIVAIERLIGGGLDNSQ